MSQSFTSNQIYTQPAINGGRLSLVSGSPLADASNAGTLYWVPYKSSYIALYNGVRWLAINAGEKSLALTLTSGKVYDVFGYLNSSGTLALETLVWSSTTARATNLTTQDGCYVKSGDATRRYLGTIYASGTNQCTHDSTIGGVWNADNQVSWTGRIRPTGSTHTYTTATVREWQGSTTNGLSRVTYVCGLPSDVLATGAATATNSNVSAAFSPGLGYDSSTTPSGTNGLVNQQTSNCYAMFAFSDSRDCAVGVHSHRLLQTSQATGTTTWLDGGSGAGYFGQSGADVFMMM